MRSGSLGSHHRRRYRYRCRVYYCKSHRCRAEGYVAPNLQPWDGRLTRRAYCARLRDEKMHFRVSILTRERCPNRYITLQKLKYKGGTLPSHLQHGARHPITITTWCDAVNAHRQLPDKEGATSNMVSLFATRIVNVFVGRTDQAKSSEPLDSPWIDRIYARLSQLLPPMPIQSLRTFLDKYIRNPDLRLQQRPRREGFSVLCQSHWLLGRGEWPETVQDILCAKSINHLTTLSKTNRQIHIEAMDVLS